MKKTPLIPLAIVSCVALALSACNQKSTSDADAAKERQLQEMQTKLDALNSRSDDLSKQLAARDAADQEARRQQLTKDQADVENQRAQLQADRNALAKSSPQTNNDDVSESAGEPVYQGKPANYDLFYTKLENDGNWIESQDYGYIWQPSVATRNSRWRPYTDGHWVETDRGWTWDSNERFGWATYHYGRWVNLDGSGWCWVPGNEWAPAWVSWRSSDRYVGWAPLPPEARLERGGSINASTDVGYDTGPAYYNFVDTQDFGEETYVGRVVEPERNIAIIDQTTNVTNITYNSTAINNFGPDYDQIGRRSHRPINRYRLDLERNSQFEENSAIPRTNGNRLAIVAPVFAAQRPDNNVRPLKVEKKILKTNRERGWQGVQPEQKQAVQAQLQKQANQLVQHQQIASEQKRQATATQQPSAEKNTPVPQNPASAVQQTRPPQKSNSTPPPNPETAAAMEARRKLRENQPPAQPAISQTTIDRPTPSAVKPEAATVVTPVPQPAQPAGPSAAQLEQQKAAKAQRQQAAEAQKSNQQRANQAAEQPTPPPARPEATVAAEPLRQAPREKPPAAIETPVEQAVPRSAQPTGPSAAQLEQQKALEIQRQQAAQAQAQAQEAARAENQQRANQAAQAAARQQQAAQQQKNQAEQQPARPQQAEAPQGQPQQQRNAPQRRAPEATPSDEDATKAEQARKKARQDQSQP